MSGLRKPRTAVITSRPEPSNVANVAISRGRRVLSALFASSRAGVAAHLTIVLDDGTPLDCKCPAASHNTPCWHLAPQGVSAIIAAFWHARWGNEPTSALLWREGELRHYLSLEPDEADANASRLEWGVLGDIIGERGA